MKIVKTALLLAQATALFGQYHYFQSDTFGSINTTNWWNTGNPIFTSHGLSAQGNAALLSNLAVPDGSSDYEVKMTVAFGDNSQGDLLAVAYLRDFNGSYPFVTNSQAYWVEFDVSSSTGSCNYSLYKKYWGDSNITLLAQGGGPCQDGSTLRSIVYVSPGVDAFFGIYIDDDLAGSIIDASGLPTGDMGVGIINGCSSGCGGFISRADIGGKDRVNPNPVSQGGIGTIAWANRVDMQWQAATDDPNGIGVAIYGNFAEWHVHRLAG